MAVAAAAAGLLLLRPEVVPRRGPEVPTRPVARTPAAGAPATAGVTVQAPETGRLAVFETRDPTITVVWFLP